MKLYLAGKITDDSDYKEKFQTKADELQAAGNIVLNPAILPEGFEQYEYMHVCYSMIDICEGVYFMSTWSESKGAKLEHEYAINNAKSIIYEERN